MSNFDLLLFPRRATNWRVHPNVPPAGRLALQGDLFWTPIALNGYEFSANSHFHFARWRRHPFSC